MDELDFINKIFNILIKYYIESPTLTTLITLESTHTTITPTTPPNIYNTPRRAT
jgi:hypothetical protein